MSVTDEPKGPQGERLVKISPDVLRKKELQEVIEGARSGCMREALGCFGTVALGVIALAICSGIAYKAYESIQQLLNR